MKSLEKMIIGGTIFAFSLFYQINAAGAENHSSHGSMAYSASKRGALKCFRSLLENYDPMRELSFILKNKSYYSIRTGSFVDMSGKIRQTLKEYGHSKRSSKSKPDKAVLDKAFALDPFGNPRSIEVLDYNGLKRFLGKDSPFNPQENDFLMIARPENDKPFRAIVRYDDPNEDSKCKIAGGE